ncbi:MAG: spore germination protein [Clostridia bacterium]|nr:spore germination protein [Clostridia bacterium]
MGEKNANPLSYIYTENVEDLRNILNIKENFDLIERHLTVADSDMCFFYIDGFVKDGEMLRIMQYLLSLKKPQTAEELEKKLPYVEVARTFDKNEIIRAILSGQTAILTERFGNECILLDLRTYPARPTQEPETDKVMQGARDGFVETLVINTALIRRRIRDPRLVMEYTNIGGSSATDIVICYMKGICDEELLESVRKKINEAKPKTLTLGFQSLAESLVRSGWFNPFPKIRTTERPDTAAAQVLEGNIIVLCDTSPQAMILPTSIFSYLEETDDFCFPPLTGTYLRLVRTFILLLSVVITPLWYLSIEYSYILPSELLFLVPDNPGAIPIIMQLFLVEIAIDGLKIASMNTPDILSNSLSVVGALILGDFAVDVGWLCGDVILYMAFVAIANFAQQNHELGYAFKFMRVIILFLVYFLGIWGFGLGLAIFCILVATNKTVTGKRHYLYPLIPFEPKVFLNLFIRRKKHDFESKTK